MADGEALAADAGLPWPAGDVASLQGAASRLLGAARDLGNVGSQVGGLRAESVGWAGAAAVWASGVAAGTMASRSGKARVAPIPRMNVRRLNPLLVLLRG